jgi:site-specific recombinase XerD
MPDSKLVRRGAHDVSLAKPLPLDQNPAAVYLASLSPGSRRTMREALNVIATTLGVQLEFDSGGRDITFLVCNWGVLRFQHTALIRSRLMEHYSAATANKMLSALRGTLKRAWRLGQMKADEYQAAIDLDSVKGEKPQAAAGRSLAQGELLALMNACVAGSSLRNARDAALLALAYACGLRRSEMINLDVSSFDIITNTLTVKGKRNKTRALPIEGGALDALKDWLAARGETKGPLFVRLLKGDKITRERLSSQAVYRIEQRRAAEAGVAAFSPHDFRRTFAGDLLDAGVDLATVQKLMGHSNASTTAGYDRRGERAKRQAVRSRHVPYKRRGEKRGQEVN